MKQFLNKLSLSTGLWLYPLTVRAQNTDVVCEQIKLVDRNATCAKDPVIFNSLVNNIINVLIFVVGGVSVIIIVVAGLMYVVSAGDPNNTKRAKDALLYALIGLAVAIFARLLVSFVIGRL